MKHKRVLLVEDDPYDVELALLALKECNLENEVMVARNGEQALDYLCRRGHYKDIPEGLPDIVFLDL